jgi:hypothetical protein
VGFLRSQIWTPTFVLRLTMVDCMGWMLRLVPRVLMSSMPPVRKSYHRVCFLLPHVKPIHFLPIIEKQGVVVLFLHPVHFVLGAGGLVPGVLHADHLLGKVSQPHCSIMSCRQNPFARVTSLEDSSGDCQAVGP